MTIDFDGLIPISVDESKIAYGYKPLLALITLNLYLVNSTTPSGLHNA